MVHIQRLVRHSNDENLTSHVQQDEQCLDRLLDLYHIPICQIILLSKKTAIFVMVQKFLPVFKRMCLMVISPSRWDYTTFGLNAIVIFISIQHFLACIFDSSLYKDLAIQQSQHLFRLLMQIYGAWTNSHRLTILQNIVLALINVTQQSVWSDLFSIKNNLHIKSSSGYYQPPCIFIYKKRSTKKKKKTKIISKSFQKWLGDAQGW